MAGVLRCSGGCAAAGPQDALKIHGVIQQGTAINLKIMSRGGIADALEGNDIGIQIRQCRAEFSERIQAPGYANMARPGRSEQIGLNHILGTLAEQTEAAVDQIETLSIAR